MKPSSGIKKYLWVIVAAGALGFLTNIAVRASKNDFPQGDQPRIGIVKRRDLIQRVTAAGSVSPNKRTVITAPYNGYIKKIFVTMGEQVKADSPVVNIVQSLHGRADDSFPLRAPFTGTVVQILHTEGEYVETGKDNSGIVRIDDDSRLFVVANVAESEIDDIRQGEEAKIRTTADQSRIYKGVIREISRAAIEKPNARPGEHVEFSVKIEVLDKDERIKSGMSTLVDIVTAKRSNVLVLPHEYVGEDKDGYFVTTIDGVRRAVRVGLQNEDSFQILDGLHEGDRVKMVDFLSLENEND